MSNNEMKKVRFNPNVDVVYVKKWIKKNQPNKKTITPQTITPQTITTTEYLTTSTIFYIPDSTYISYI